MADIEVVNSTYFESQLQLDIILGNFIESKRNYDLYDSPILKGITLLIYISEIVSSLIMFAFVHYERSGDAGSYRTFNNQLLAYLHGGVRPNYLQLMNVETDSKKFRQHQKLTANKKSTIFELS